MWVKRDLQLLLGIFSVDSDVRGGDFLISHLEHVVGWWHTTFRGDNKATPKLRSQILRSKVEQFLIYPRSSTPSPNPRDHHVALSTVSPEVIIGKFQFIMVGTVYIVYNRPLDRRPISTQ